MASRRRSGAQNQPLQSRRPEQIEAFQPFHHVRPLIYQHVVEFDFADAWATILPVAIFLLLLVLSQVVSGHGQNADMQWWGQ